LDKSHLTWEFQVARLQMGWSDRRSREWHRPRTNVGGQ
jgi:hypothetical protein